MNIQNHIDIIVKVLENRILVPKQLLIEENYSKPLTGEIFGLGSIELAYFFFELEKEFGLTFDYTQILKYEFNTISGIERLLTSQPA